MLRIYQRIDFRAHCYQHRQVGGHRSHPAREPFDSEDCKARSYENEREWTCPSYERLSEAISFSNFYFGGSGFSGFYFVGQRFTWSPPAMNAVNFFSRCLPTAGRAIPYGRIIRDFFECHRQKTSRKRSATVSKATDYA